MADEQVTETPAPDAPKAATPQPAAAAPAPGPSAKEAAADRAIEAWMASSVRNTGLARNVTFYNLLYESLGDLKAAILKEF